MKLIISTKRAKAVSLAETPKQPEPYKPQPYCPSIHLFGDAAKRLTDEFDRLGVGTGDTIELKIRARLTSYSEGATENGVTCSCGLEAVAVLEVEDETVGGNEEDGEKSGGNFGHAGRPGQVGGSAPRSGGGRNNSTNINSDASEQFSDRELRSLIEQTIKELENEGDQEVNDAAVIRRLKDELDITITKDDLKLLIKPKEKTGSQFGHAFRGNQHVQVASEDDEDDIAMNRIKEFRLVVEAIQSREQEAKNDLREVEERMREKGSLTDDQIETDISTLEVHDDELDDGLLALHKGREFDEERYDEHTEHIDQIEKLKSEIEDTLDKLAVMLGEERPTRRAGRSARVIRVKRFELSMPIDARDGKEVVSYRTVRDDDGNVTDYQDVRIKGYLTTWKETTPADRDGEWVLKGALGKSLKKFMKNPVMLRDHKNSTEHVAGRFTKAQEDDTGLYVEGVLSNKPGMKDVRFDVVEKNLCTLSMGGAFRYGVNRKGIEEVALFEGTLTPIPANPDARFTLADVSSRGKAYLASGGALDGLKSLEKGGCGIKCD